MFTAFPVLATGLLERDVPRAVSRASPRLYRATAAGADLAAPALLAWGVAAVWHSAVCFGVPIAALAVGAGGGADGAPLGLWPTGTLSTCVVVVVNLKLLIASRTLTWLHGAVVAASIALYFGYLAAYSAIPPAKLAPLAPAGAMAGVAGALAVTPAAWIGLVVAVVGSLLPDVLLSARWGGEPGAVSCGDGSADVESVASSPRREHRASCLAAATKSPTQHRWSLTARSGGSPPPPSHRLETALSHTGFAFDAPAESSYHARAESRDAVRRTRGSSGSGIVLRRTGGSGSAAAGALAPPPRRPPSRAAGSVHTASGSASGGAPAAARPDIIVGSHPLASPRGSTAPPDVGV